MSRTLSLNQYLINHLETLSRTGYSAKFKHKKKKIRMSKAMVSKGHITINLNLSPSISCPCGKSGIGSLFCEHLYHIFIENFKLPVEVMILLSKVESAREYFSLLTGGVAVDFNDVRTQMISYSDNFYHELECPVCLASLDEGTSPKEIFICNRCQQICHAACIENWCKTKNERKDKKEIKGCIFCRDKITEL